MRRFFIALALSAACVPAFAAAAQRGGPRVPAEANDVRGFVPRGWRVETVAKGDLNGDRRQDLAFVLIGEASAPYAPPRYGNQELRSDPPRILGVAFGRRTGGYALAVQNRHFLPRKRPPNGLSAGWMLFEEGSVAVSRGRLQTIFQYTRSHLTFTFRWEKGAFRLIGYDAGGVSGGCATSLSINFLTRRARLSAGHIDEDADVVRWRRLRPRPLATLDRIGDGEEFDPYGPDRGFPLWCRERE